MTPNEDPMRPINRRSLLAVSLLAAVSLALGVLAAFTDGAGGATTPAPAPAAAAPPPTAPAPAATRPGPPAPGVACRPQDPAPAAAPVPQAILDAFAVLRRDRADADALPADALRALRARGLEPFDPAAARVLRTDGAQGKAWIVPVRDAQVQRVPFPCPVRVDRRGRNLKYLPVRPAKPDTPQPGVAIVAVGGAPVGAGGPLEDVIRGREPVAVDPCGGPDGDMLGVSGVVPDGVVAVFLTSPDGTAVKADVTDNAYTFVVPRTRTPEQRYVVWTGGDGTPHVQPMPAALGGLRVRCPQPVRRPIAVSPDATAGCTTPFAGAVLGAPALPVARVPSRVVVRPGGRRVGVPPVPAPAPALFAARCDVAPPIALPVPAPAPRKPR